jgi:hypothetical protein
VAQAPGMSIRLPEYFTQPKALMINNALARAIRNHWPLLLATGVFGRLFVSAVGACRGQNGGRFVYPIDDSYIHMAIAKNVARHGVWGVTRFAFGASSSSPLWTCALAAIYKAAGVHDLAPLVLGAGCALGTLWVIGWIAVREELPWFVTAVLLLGVVIGAPLVSLAVSGMESPGQMLIDVLFLYAAGRAAAGRILSTASGAGLVALAALAVAIRYEGLFLVGMACLVLAARGRWRLALAIGLAALTPVAIFGAVAVKHGGLWLPNSVMLKGTRPSFGSFREARYALGGRAIDGLIGARWVGSLALAAAAALLTALWGRRKASGARPSSPAIPMLIISLGTAILHMQFAEWTWFSRYEGYLVVLLMLSIAVALAGVRIGLFQLPQIEVAKRIAAFATVAAFILYPPLSHGITALGEVPTASQNIYEQQCQMARFVGRYYSGDTIVLNDIGAVCYYVDIRLVDPVGLDGVEIARRRLAGTYRTALVGDIARREHARIAIVYERFMKLTGDAPEDWRPIGTWRILNNMVCGDDVVTFYALRPEEVPLLRAHLLEFNPGLPPSVVRRMSP